jgi:hypothetical protein
LSVFVSTSQKDDQFSSVLLEIHPIASAIVNSQLRDTFTNWFDIPWASGRQTFDPDLDSRSASKVTQLIEPMRKQVGLADLNH